MDVYMWEKKGKEGWNNIWRFKVRNGFEKRRVLYGDEECKLWESVKEYLIVKNKEWEGEREIVMRNKRKEVFRFIYEKC